MYICLVLTFAEVPALPSGYAQSSGYSIGAGLIPFGFSGSFERLALTAPWFHYTASGLNLSEVHTSLPGLTPLRFRQTLRAI